MSKPSPIPPGYPTATPYLTLDDAAGAIAFYERAFGAKLRSRMDGPGGKIMHAEILIGDSPVMLADAPDPSCSPAALGGSPVFLHLYVEDVDAAFARAIDAGATETRPVADQFYGDRLGMLVDPFGHRWSLASRIEELTDEEINARGAALAKQ